MKTCSITLRISEAEKEALMNLAKEKDIPASQIVREAIKEYLKKPEEKLPLMVWHSSLDKY